jgi:dihydroorotase-like cyclic amidohydrolase
MPLDNPPKLGRALLETDGDRTIDARELEFLDESAKRSPYDGRKVRVFPRYTLARGVCIYAEGAVIGELGQGQFVTRDSAP